MLIAFYAFYTIHSWLIISSKPVKQHDNKYIFFPNIAHKKLSERLKDLDNFVKTTFRICISWSNVSLKFSGPCYIKCLLREPVKVEKKWGVWGGWRAGWWVSWWWLVGGMRGLRWQSDFVVNNCCTFFSTLTGSHDIYYITQNI